jgi:hypothetical protein
MSLAGRRLGLAIPPPGLSEVVAGSAFWLAGRPRPAIGRIALLPAAPQASPRLWAAFLADGPRRPVDGQGRRMGHLGLLPGAWGGKKKRQKKFVTIQPAGLNDG